LLRLPSCLIFRNKSFRSTKHRRLLFSWRRKGIYVKRVTCFTVVIAFVLAAAVPASVQVCGDVNGDEKVNISDMVYLFNYMTQLGPSPIYQNMADCDDHFGITIGDVYRLHSYFFATPFGDPPDCSPSKSYSYTPAPDDTVFIPRMYGIPESLDSAFVPIMTSFETSTVGFYVPVSMPFGYDEAFQLHHLYVHDFGYTNPLFLVGSLAAEDTAVFAGSALNGEFSGTRNILMGAVYTREEPGPADIVMEPADHLSNWQFAILKDDGDLYTPVIEYFDVTTSFLQASAYDLTFTALAGDIPPDLYWDVDLTSSGDPVNWQAEVSDEWIVLDFTSGTTPSTIRVTVAPGEDLPAGLHYGTITISDTDNPYNFPLELNVELTLQRTFPSMDANCDGKFNITDVAYILTYMFGIPPGPPPCDPCTGQFPKQQ